MNVCVVVAAAGRSDRFGGSDKLAADLGGRPLLIRTVEIFTKRDEVASVIVAGPPDSLEDFKNKYGATLGFLGATVVAGGRVGRWETIKNALALVPDDATHVAVHDAARPGVPNELLNRIFEAARSLGAVIPAVTITATVKRVDEEPVDVTAPEDDAIADQILGEAGRVVLEARKVTETIPRRGLVEVQTPQVFAADLIRRAYAQADLDQATDDASLVERLGEPVHVIEGDVRNLKVTRPEDLKLMRSILGVKPPAERPVHKRF